MTEREHGPFRLGRTGSGPRHEYTIAAEPCQRRRVERSRQVRANRAQGTMLDHRPGDDPQDLLARVSIGIWVLLHAPLPVTLKQFHPRADRGELGLPYSDREEVRE